MAKERTAKEIERALARVNNAQDRVNKAHAAFAKKYNSKRATFQNCQIASVRYRCELLNLQVCAGRLKELIIGAEINLPNARSTISKVED